MKNVGDLIAKLQTLDPKLPVLISSFDEYNTHYTDEFSIRQIEIGKFRVKTSYSDEYEKMGCEPHFEEFYAECNQYNRESDAIMEGFPLQCVVFEEE